MVYYLPNDETFCFRYIEEYCSPEVAGEKLILFQDDDTVVTEKDFEKFVRKPERRDKNIPYCLGSWTVANAPIIRPDSKKFSPEEVQKWSVTEEVYPKPFYPPYCSGTCYAISSIYAKTIAHTASVTNPQGFHHDDVLFTGILRVKADIDVPKKVNGICRHYNQKTKIKDIQKAVLYYCKKNNIAESLCIIK